VKLASLTVVHVQERRVADDFHDARLSSTLAIGRTYAGRDTGRAMSQENASRKGLRPSKGE
jgi:hypothetical protein